MSKKPPGAAKPTTNLETSPNEESTKYSVMLSDVEKIIHSIEKQDINIDDLIPSVEKALHLIEKMQTKLEKTKVKIETLTE